MAASGARPALYDPDATIALIGMRGVGKTTLGLIAATSLRRQFIDADSAFQTLHGPIAAFVSAHGWSAFRDMETQILRRLLKEHPTGYVIACGGGVVERKENRELLQEFRDSRRPIVHVVRDKEETVAYLVDETARPSWGEEIRHVWARRQPHFESLATHTIVSLTADPPPSSPQFLMKHVETAFVRLLRSIFGLASSHVSVALGPRPSPVAGPSSGEYGGYGASESEMGRAAKGSRTLFVALNFPDLRHVSCDTIRKVAGGVDCIELRVDTLVQALPDTPPDSRRGSPVHSQPSRSHSGLPASVSPKHSPIPSLHFVALCFGHLRRCSPLPILYTVRTVGEGGVFPDPYDSEELLEQYISLLELGFKLGAEYVDIESKMPDNEIKRLLSWRGSATQCLGTYHDVEGKRRWGSPEMMDTYLRATSFGFDIVKLISRPISFNSNLELLKFRQKVAAIEKEQGRQPTPLLAINLDKGGQISRFLNPVFTPVTHPLLPGVAAPGQLTYQQTQQALFLSGLILEKTFFVPTSSIAETFSRESLSLGLPYTFLVEDRIGMRDTEAHFGGAFLGPRHAISTSAISPRDHLLSPAQNSSYVDLVVPASTEPDSYDVPPVPLAYYKHTNVRVLALAELITQNLSPINAVGIHTAALVVGLARKDLREVLEALRIVGARWVSLFACEQDESESMISTPTIGSPRYRQSTSRNVSRAGTPSALPYPLPPPLQTTTINSFTSPTLYQRRPPTIIISSDAAPSFPDSLFASPTGGAALDMSMATLSGGGRGGTLTDAVSSGSYVGKGHREGWQILGLRDVESEVERQAFKALTGRRMVG